MRALGALPGAAVSTAVGINNAGQIVGLSGEHAFLYSNGTMQDLTAMVAFEPQMGVANVAGINNSGVIAATLHDQRTEHGVSDAAILTPIASKAAQRSAGAIAATSRRAARVRDVITARR